MKTLILLCLVGAAFSAAVPQFEGGFIKILEDKRYQDGAAFGNFRDQEDGIKYFEETDGHGIRKGYWEYPSPSGQVLRTEFEAGPGIGFRITKSNHHDATPVAKPQPQFQPVPPPRQAPVHQPLPRPRQPVHNTLPVHNPHHVHNPVFTPTTTPYAGPQDLFDYPGNLEFSRSHQGHRFKFTAT